MKVAPVQSKRNRFPWFFSVFVFCGLSILLLNRFYQISEPVLECPAQPTLEPVENRIRIAQRLWDQVDRNVDYVMLVSNPRGLRPESDMDLPGYRQLGNILYLLDDYKIDGSILILNRCTDLCLTVFLPETTERQKVFSGTTFDLEALSRTHQAKFKSLHELPDYLGHGKLVLCPSNVALIHENIQSIAATLAERDITIQSSDLVQQVFVETRFVKSQAELNALRFTSQVAALAHRRLEHDIKVGRFGEAVLASKFELYSVQCGSRLQAYNPIVGAGPHAAVLHFPTGETLDQGLNPIKDNQFVLVDAAGSFHGYASDLTRTYHRSSPSQEMLKIHQAVANVQEIAIKQFKEGAAWKKIHNDSLINIGLELGRLGFHSVQQGEALVEVAKLFMPHGLGHLIGLDTHDPIPTKYPDGHYLLVRGIVHTIEPGIYFIPYLLDQHRTNTSAPLNRLINWKVVDQYFHVGGVRIEDVVAINLQGDLEIFTRL